MSQIPVSQSSDPITAEVIARALGGKRRGRAWTCRCPAHSDRTPSLQIKDEDNGVDLKCWALCSTSQIIAVLRERGLWNDDTQLSVKPKGSVDPQLTPTHLAARNLWERSRDPRGTLAETYLKNRGLPLPDFACGRALRFADAVPLDDGWAPALVARLISVRCHERNELSWNDLPCVHVIFLKPDGSGYIDKRTWGSPYGSALVYLSKVDEYATEWHIGEGIETMLGAYANRGAFPIAAALTTSSLAYIPVTEPNHNLVIWTDNDDAGRKAARMLRRRWQFAGRNVTEIRRRQANADFADPKDHPS